MGRSRPTAWPEGTLGSVALETRVSPEKLLDPASKGAWQHQTQLWASSTLPHPNPRHINPAVPRVQPAWESEAGKHMKSLLELALFHPLLWGPWAPSHILSCDLESRDS